MSMCPKGAISQPTKEIKAQQKEQNKQLIAPKEIVCQKLENKPTRLSLAIRGIGGQGNLFFGKALEQSLSSWLWQ